MPKPAKKRIIHLYDVPDDVFDFLLKEQTTIKRKKKVGQFSIERALYSVIRSHPDFINCKDCG